MFTYFGYGSNMCRSALLAKDVAPVSSEPGRLVGYQLRFNVSHWYRHEGGVGNIEPTGDPADEVLGVLHEIPDEQLASMDATEAYGYGYTRKNIVVETKDGPKDAVAYVGMESHIDDSCLPTRRYLNILVRGATEAGIEPSYIEDLRNHPVLDLRYYPEFTAPDGDHPTFTASTLAEQPMYTAIGGFAFDMTGAREGHEYLFTFFGGRDVTEFVIRRHDTARGNETLEDFLKDRLTPGQEAYLNAYRHEFDREYTFVGYYDFAEDIPSTE